MRVWKTLSEKFVLIVPLLLPGWRVGEWGKPLLVGPPPHLFLKENCSTLLFSWSREAKSSWLCSFWQVKKCAFPHGLQGHTKFYLFFLNLPAADSSEHIVGLWAELQVYLPVSGVCVSLLCWVLPSRLPCPWGRKTASLQLPLKLPVPLPIASANLLTHPNHFVFQVPWEWIFHLQTNIIIWLCVHCIGAARQRGCRNARRAAFTMQTTTAHFLMTSLDKN